MKFRNTLILLGVLIVLFLIVYFFDIRKSQESTDKSKNVGAMLLMEKEDVKGVELVYADPDYEKIVCSKDSDGQWQIEQPLKAKADQKVMDRLISGAMDRNVHETLEDAGELADYGLDNPRVTAQFHLRDGASRTLMVGKTVPTGSYAYIKQKSMPDISLVPASIADDLTRFVSDLRDRTVIALEKSDVEKIQLKYADRESIVCKKDGFDWNLIEPVAAKADTSAVEKLISDLNGLTVDRFVAEEPDDVSIYGLLRPQIEVTVYLAEGQDRTLLIGREEEGSVYVKTSSEKPVFSVKGEIVGKLTKQPSDLRDRTVIAFDSNSVEKLELKYPGRSIVCEKKAVTDSRSKDANDEEVWSITAPTRAKADRSEIEGILRRLNELKVDTFVSDRPENLAVYGLTQPQIEVIISFKGSGSKTLLVGEKEKSVYVKTASGQSVYLVDSGIADDLTREPMHLRDRQMMKFERDHVKRIQLERKDETIVCIKQEHDWRIVEPVKEKAKNYEVTGILTKLDGLEAETFVVEKAPQLSEYGLDQPDVKVTLTFEDGNTEALLVGKKLPDSDSAYAKVAREDVVFAVEKDVVDELKKDLEEIRE